MDMIGFKSLSHIEQEELVLNCGVFFLNYVLDDHMCDVYTLFDFYVKFCYDINLEGKVEIIVASGKVDFKLHEERFFQLTLN